ncbi:MAG: transglutaminase [Bacteroidetes bacterium]|nr:transglutaminase [Bacteroidota bacterium]
MQKPIIFLVAFLSVMTLWARGTHNGLPVIEATNSIAGYRIGNDWFENKWVIIPQIKEDTLTIPCYSPVEDVAFYTDQDSIHIDLLPNQSYKFFILLNDTAYASTIIRGVHPALMALTFDTITPPVIPVIYEQGSSNRYLIQLREKYKLNRIVKHADNDTERALEIMHWVHRQWKHDGYNAAKKRDALSILDAARNGNNFRCVEYGIVTAACLNAIGLKARVLSLKIKEVETTLSGAGHVATEVFLNDRKRWVLLDSQWDAMPVLNGIPLNAVEFQQAITCHYSQLTIGSLSGVSKRMYVNWIYPYLYYFNFPFDNREGRDIERKTIDGKKALMLVPVGAKNPTLFQQNRKLDYCIYTNGLKEFYASPDNR